MLRSGRQIIRDSIKEEVIEQLRKGKGTVKQHYCLDESYPGGKNVCLCARGKDHPEELFDVVDEDDE